MRVISLLLAIVVAGCGRQSIDPNSAKLFAASELALFQREVGEVKPVVEPTKPTPSPTVACKCNGTHYVNDRSSGKLRRVACPCGQSCKCIGVAMEAEKRPEVLFWSAKWCKNCKPILAELEACADELPFRVVVKDYDETRPDWIETLPTLHWCVDFEKEEWKAFSVTKDTPWPGVDGFKRVWLKSFPQRASAAQPKPPAYGISAGKFPIRATVQQVKQFLSDRGLSLPYGMKVNAPTHGVVASITQAGQDVAIEFDETTLPAVSFSGKVRSVLLGETRGSIAIDGLPDVSFEVVP